jgi:hypothetical protein
MLTRNSGAACNDMLLSLSVMGIAFDILNRVGRTKDSRRHEDVGSSSCVSNGDAERKAYRTAELLGELLIDARRKREVRPVTALQPRATPTSLTAGRAQDRGDRREG